MLPADTLILAAFGADQPAADAIDERVAAIVDTAHPNLTLASPPIFNTLSSHQSLFITFIP